MRIVHVVRQFHPAIGGLENVVWELGTAQVAKGHDVRVVTLDRLFNSPRTDRLPHHESIEGLEIVRIPYSGSRRYPLAWSVLRHIRDADVVHVHGIDFFFDYLAVTKPLHRRVLVASTHGGFFHTNYAARLKRIYFATVTRLALRSYAGVATVSAADHAFFRAVRPRGLSLIENGVNIVTYADAAATSPRKGIVSIGRFSDNKRIDRLVSFFAALHRRDPQWRLHVVGRPWDLSAADVERLAQAAGVGHAVEVVELPSTDAVRDIMSRCSVIASASAYEGFGLTAVEGLSAGLQPLLSDIPPFRQLVERTGLGTIVDFDDPEDAAAGFLADWSAVAADYGARRAAAIEAAQAFSWDRVSGRYEDFYQSALGNTVRTILDVTVRVSTRQAAFELLDTRASRGEPAIVVFANAHTLNVTSSDRRVRSALRNSIVFNDGIGVDIASRLLFGKPFPDNLNGTDFVPAYLQHTKRHYRIYLVGSRPGIAERAAAHFLRLAPRHQVVGCHHGYVDATESTRVAAEIRRSGADLLLVAMGDPKQELWLTEHLPQTGCRLGFAVGALFDFMAGAVPRAPAWVQSARLEWAYRLVQEPGRLWRRYLVGTPSFLVKVARQWLAGERVSSAMQD